MQTSPPQLIDNKERKRLRARWERQRAKIAPIVRARDGHKCVTCGSTYLLATDHIIPLARGGASDITNLQTLCYPCNSRKGVR